MMNERKFPSEIYITIEDDGDQFFLCAHDKLDTVDDDADVMIYGAQEVNNDVTYRKTTTHDLIVPPPTSTKKKKKV